MDNKQVFLNTKLKSLNQKHSAWLTVDVWECFLSEWKMNGWINGRTDGQEDQTSKVSIYGWSKTQKIYES